MERHFFESGFQFERYINQQLLEISDESERRALKTLMRDTLIPFYEHVESAYFKLEERFTKRQEMDKGRYEIITGIERRNLVDVTEDAMVPMDYADLNEPMIDSQEMQEMLRQGEAYQIMRVFISADYSEIARLEREKRCFKAIINTEEGEYPAEVILKKNTSYYNKIGDLYEVFVSNGIEWNTVCMPYLAKFFDVFIIKTQCPETEKIVGIHVDFEEYKSKMIYDMVPMWNVRLLEESTSAYPDFALDRIHYEHCIYGNRIKENRDYFVYTEDIKIWDIFRQDGDLHIVCDQEEPTRWKLIEFGYDAWKGKYEYPIYGNYWVNKNNYRCIHTIAEIKKVVLELGYEKELELLSVSKKEGAYASPRMTYSMDAFIEDEIRIGANRLKLVFVFREKDKGNYLNKDIMSYIVSRIQWQLPEFECIGELE